MNYISAKIKGIPYGKNKRRGDIGAPERWSAAIREQTCNLPKIKDACIIKLTFFLPADKFPTDFPYGSDLDNLIKRFFDALCETIFSETAGKDSCVLSLNATKVKVSSHDEAGVYLEILPVAISN